MATHLSARSAKMWLYHLKRSRKRGSLCLNVIREICLYFEDFLLVQVTNAFLRFFNCESSTWNSPVPLRTLITANSRSSWVVLKDGRVFCSGGIGKH